ncbi:hypothetical protein Taro_053143 [Colocasia esculenta]|uniref:Uncharacterized protein n=1 Tax=Colocasia esculenta TaxID=4460 RepID=A0A843XK48_COLES|nr:hypothetical protein [Colocasia esculenta]
MAYKTHEKTKTSVATGLTVAIRSRHYVRSRFVEPGAGVNRGQVATCRPVAFRTRRFFLS